MSLGRRFVSTGAGDAVCLTESVQVFGADSTYSSNIALYQLDGNDDDTTGNFSGSSESYVTYSSTGAKFGQAATFNGSSSYIALSGNPINGQSNISISFWIKPDDVSSDQYVITFVNSDGGWNGFGIRISSSAKIQVVRANSGTVTTSENSTATLSTGSWKHIVVTSSQSEVKIYIDGVLDSTHSISGFTTNNTGEYNIGALKNAGSYSQFYDGVLDQVRVFNKVISSQDVSTLYAETSSTASNTNPLGEGAGVALYSMDYDASEESGYFSGSPTDVDFGVGGKTLFGARFNGSSSYIDIDNISGIGGTSSSVSISAWFNFDGTSGDRFIISLRDGCFAEIGFNSGYSPRKLEFKIYDGANKTVLVDESSITNNSWHHIVLTAESNGLLTAYLDNVSQGTTSIGNITSNTQHNAIGAYNISGTPAGYFTGDIDQVRIFSKALSSDEVDTLWNNGNGEIACVHTATTTDNDYPTTNLAYYKLDNSAEDSHSGTYDGTESNIEYRFGKYGQAAVFNGSNAYIDLGTSIATSTRGVSIWVNADNFSERWAFQQGDGQGVENYIRFYNTDDIQVRWGNVTQTFSGYSANTWIHIFAQKDENDNANVWINGVEMGSTGTPSAITVNKTYLGVRNNGGSLQYYFDGKIDQVRLFASALTSSQIIQLYNEKPEIDTSNFKAILYKGSSSKQYISNVRFNLDVDNGGDGGFIWIKQRTLPTRDHRNYDTVRGIYPIYSSRDLLEGTSNPIDYDANGFFFAGGESGVNENAEDYVAWVWRAGGEAVNIGVNTITGSTPSIASDVSANTAAGFSIVKATFNTSSPQTVAHGLSSAPEVIFSKRVSGSSVSSGDWNLYHKFIDSSYPENYFIKLNERDGRSDNAIYWNDTAPTSNVFTTGSIYDQSETVIFYCWHSVNSYSKIGTYEGNGTSDNKIYTTDDGTSTGSYGFKPSFVMLKNVDRSNTGWLIHDTARDPINTSFRTLRAESNEVEYTSTSYWLMDFESDGFRLKYGADNEFNKLDETYIYMAFK